MKAEGGGEHGFRAAINYVLWALEKAGAGETIGGRPVLWWNFRTKRVEILFLEHGFTDQTGSEHTIVKTADLLPEQPALADGQNKGQGKGAKEKAKGGKAKSGKGPSQFQSLMRDAIKLKENMGQETASALDVLKMVSSKLVWKRWADSPFVDDIRKTRETLDELKQSAEFWCDWHVQDGWGRGWAKKKYGEDTC